MLTMGDFPSHLSRVSPEVDEEKKELLRCLEANWQFPAKGWTRLDHEFNKRIYLPSGKHTKNYGKSPCLMGKSTINGHFQ